MEHTLGFSRNRILLGILLIFPVLFLGFASAGDGEIDAYLGDTITLHGYSYIGDTVYLFMTGPGLPVNGVALTDISMRADQGHFTMVGLDENQAWTYQWQTSRIANEINPGTYTVYISDKPKDLANLVPGSYKEITVFLRESDYSRISITAQHVYTLNPEHPAATPGPTAENTTIPTPAGTTAAPATTTPPPTIPVPASTRADPGFGAVLAGLVCGSILVTLLRRR